MSMAVVIDVSVTHDKLTTTATWQSGFKKNEGPVDLFTVKPVRQTV